jgi:tetratricopeptide (TPR) repeat protein
MSTAQIIYAMVFRLSIIAAGFGCVVMGYRLFVLGVMPKENSEMEATVGGDIRLSVRNAAPGTCFAVLGMLMIAAMLLQGNPEKRVSEISTREGMRREVEVTWRSDGEDIEAQIAKGQELEKAGRLDEAIKAYAESIKDGNLAMIQATGPLRAIAAVYLKQDRLEEAIAYASLAYHVDPGNANGLALIARIQLRQGKYNESIKAISEAARIDSAFIVERDRMKDKKP